MKVAVTGSSGLIARHLVPALEAAGHEVRRVVRGDGAVSWDPPAGRIDAEALAVDAVVNLAGVGIFARRWTEAHKRALLDSRVQGTSLLAERMAATGSPPRVLLNASAVGYYGDRGDEELTEASGPGDDFLAELCRQWEGAARPASAAGVRTVFLRSGIVLAADGGALKPQLLLYKAALGGRLGDGRQWMSWIAIDDHIGAILHALGDEQVTGPVNLTAPRPVTNADFTSALAHAVHRPAVLAVPAAALRLALGSEMADALLLVSQRVTGDVLARTGYRWRHPELAPALRHILDS